MTGLRITVVSDAKSWINEFMPPFVQALEGRGHEVVWVHQVAAIPAGDLAFYLSCGQMASDAVLARNAHNLVVHASDLPKGRGWSPLSWQVLEGANEIPLCLFEAARDVDSGPVYLRSSFRMQGHELHGEMRRMLGEAAFAQSLEFVDRYPEVLAGAKVQEGEPTYYPYRAPENSRLDLDATLRDQFNLLRIVDNDKYPAFFEHRGYRYVLRIEKAGPAPGRGKDGHDG